MHLFPSKSWNSCAIINRRNRRCEWKLRIKKLIIKLIIIFRVHASNSKNFINTQCLFSSGKCSKVSKNLKKKKTIYTVSVYFFPYNIFNVDFSRKNFICFTPCFLFYDSFELLSIRHLKKKLVIPLLRFILLQFFFNRIFVS